MFKYAVYKISVVIVDDYPLDFRLLNFDTVSRKIQGKGVLSLVVSVLMYKVYKL